MGEVINKEYLTRDDLLAMRQEIDTVITTMEIMGQRIGNFIDMIGIQEQRIAELEGQRSAHANLISSLMAEGAETTEDHHARISKLETGAA